MLKINSSIETNRNTSVKSTRNKISHKKNYKQKIDTNEIHTKQNNYKKIYTNKTKRRKTTIHNFSNEEFISTTNKVIIEDKLNLNSISCDENPMKNKNKDKTN